MVFLGKVLRVAFSRVASELDWVITFRLALFNGGFYVLRYVAQTL